MSQHSLKSDGAPFTKDGQPVNDGKSTVGEGHAACNCGIVSSGIFKTRGQRRTWFADHKADHAEDATEPTPEAKPALSAVPDLPKDEPVKATKPRKAAATKTATANATKRAAAPKISAKAETRKPDADVYFTDLAKYYVDAAGVHGANVLGASAGITADRSGCVIRLYGDANEARALVTTLKTAWSAAKLVMAEAAKTWREGEAYEAMTRAERNAYKAERADAYLTAFMSGYAAQIDGKPKTRGQAEGYAEGVAAATTPALNDASDLL